MLFQVLEFSSVRRLRQGMTNRFASGKTTQWSGLLALSVLLCSLGLGFSRNARAAGITTFDAPCAGTGSFQGTIPRSISPLGVVTGYCVDADFVTHGFLRATDGALTVFDAPHAGTGASQGTMPRLQGKR